MSKFMPVFGFPVEVALRRCVRTKGAHWRSASPVRKPARTGEGALYLILPMALAALLWPCSQRSFRRAKVLERGSTIATSRLLGRMFSAWVASSHTALELTSINGWGDSPPYISLLCILTFLVQVLT